MEFLFLYHAEDDQLARLSYEGEWRDGRQTGQGTLTFRSGKPYKISWNEPVRCAPDGPSANHVLRLWPAWEIRCSVLFKR